ncbi:DNA-binding GntR family transcriptional regulator [Solibacillus kalamii]|uniref:HTH gntR-type domain-containing protein n=1 Tax=Solibacillus kalamii TaxID=1748298 RepID=A0ABX3ZFK3_9BACL|nr:GntR family transcriptional regulator [Solibacillus kalamii]MBM7665975.1 DNA-binding GntR family transcriptional regulator [Solibacillus kalamii]OUZ38483.1 hypothetical protein CBM15_12065 [Solibacillus kalamii]
MDAYQYVKERIISGHYQSGERLTEVMLANELEVSRTPVRSALQQLEFDGLVTPLAKGYVVSSFSKEDIQEIYQIRALLEGHAAFEAALNRTEQHIEVLKSANEQFMQYVKHTIAQPDEANMEKIVYFNKQFHDCVNDASGNSYLKKHIEQVVILPLVYRSFYWYDQYELKRSFEAHEAILKAIEARRPERAKSAVQEHIYNALDHILEHIGEE